jgi:hypothetical protein
MRQTISLVWAHDIEWERGEATWVEALPVMGGRECL